MQAKQKRLVALFAAVIFLTMFIILSQRRRNETPQAGHQKEVKLDPHEFYLKYLLKDIERKQGCGDIYSYTSKLRLYKKLRYLRGTTTLPEDTEAAFRKLHDHLFKWALKRHKSVEELQRSYSGKGIVICAGGKYVKLAVHAIKVFRLLGCNLPVEVFYNGPDDMNVKQQEYLKKLKNVTVKDINDFINAKELNLQTWDLKPFSMLLSSFAETILLDADTIFVHSPETITDDPGYLKTGTAFFYDRTLFGYNPHNATSWLETIMPPPLSDQLVNSRMYNRTTNYEQEAGVVVIDKSRRLMGLLATCRLNFPDYKQDLHKYTHGDKESFWLGMELADEPYYFIPSMAGTVGKFKIKDDVKQICGKAAHFDRNERLLWFNDGMVEDKHAAMSDPSLLQFYGIEGREGGTWKVLCLLCEPRPLDAGTKMNIHKILGNFERDPLEMGDPRDGAAMFLLGKT